MEWILDNLAVIANVATILAVAGVWAWQRWSGKRTELERDLERLLDEGLRFMRDWSGDRMHEVTQEQVWTVADWFYDHHGVGTFLETRVDQSSGRSMFWGAFCRWRDNYVGARAAMVGEW